MCVIYRHFSLLYKVLVFYVFVVTAVSMQPFTYLSDIMKLSSLSDVKDAVYNVKVRMSTVDTGL